MITTRLLEEYKNKVVTYPKQEEYKKNKVITVNNIDEQCEKVFFFSIKDTINYCETIGIKLDRKSIEKSIMSGENYKGLIFKYTS